MIHTSESNIPWIQTRLIDVAIVPHCLCLFKLLMPIKISRCLIFVYLLVFLRNSLLYFQDTKGEKQKKKNLISTFVQLEVEENSLDTASEDC